MAEGFEDNVEELLPAYALNALDDAERELVERALEREPRYQSLLAEYLDATNALAPVGRPVAAPDSVHERVMRQIWSQPTAAFGMATRVRPRIPVAILAAAAAWIFAVIGVGTVEMRNAQRVQDIKQEMNTLAEENVRQAERLRQQAEVVTTYAVQPGVQQASMVSVAAPQPPKDPPAGFVFTNNDGMRVLFAINLETLPEGMVYSVWESEGDGTAALIATFQVSDDGQVFVPIGPDDYEDGTSWITVHASSVDDVSLLAGDPVLWGELH